VPVCALAREPPKSRDPDVTMPFLRFPDGFQWGAATASYQVEGAVSEDDRGLSIWDTFCHQPGRVQGGDTGDVACDHYHRWREDIDLMADLGLQTYRFSVAWSRILPFGAGAVNEKGLEFYERLVDRLLEKGIAPALTLYHWDLPQALQDRGGWANRDTARHFADYARILYDRLGDRVTRWITLNEPLVFTMYGHRTGVMAPGIRDLDVTARAVHHAFLGHGMAVQAFRDSGRRGPIGITNANSSYEAADPSPETAAAVELARDFDSRLFHGPVYGRGYPESVLRYYGSRGAVFPVEPGDMEIIAAPTDFLGLNLYSRTLIEASNHELGFARARPTLPLLPMGYEAAPHALGDFVRWVTKEYGPMPISITENGVCDNTEPDAGGVIDDRVRMALLRGFLAGLHGAMEDGCDVRAYYQWSLMDNFEWAYGYSKRFGMVHTDFSTLKRTPKRSAAMFTEIIHRNGLDV
jgi:beta-glucosidase